MPGDFLVRFFFFFSWKKTQKIISPYGCFLKWWYPQIITSYRVFPYKPSILGYPYFWKHSYLHFFPVDFFRLFGPPKRLSTFVRFLWSKESAPRNLRHEVYKWSYSPYKIAPTKWSFAGVIFFALLIQYLFFFWGGPL